MTKYEIELIPKGPKAKVGRKPKPNSIRKNILIPKHLFEKASAYGGLSKFCEDAGLNFIETKKYKDGVEKAKLSKK